MTKYLTLKWRSDGPGRLSFYCPSCLDIHTVSIPDETKPNVHTWGFEFKDNKVTLTPSVALRSGHYSERFKPGDNCWCTFNKEHPDDPSKFKCGICHSFIINDRIQFLGDSTHILANQTVELPNFSKEWLERDGYIVGARIKFLKELNEPASGDHPALLYAKEGATGSIVEIGTSREGFMVKAGNWPSSFGAYPYEFELIKE